MDFISWAWKRTGPGTRTRNDPHPLGIAREATHRHTRGSSESDWMD